MRYRAAFLLGCVLLGSALGSTWVLMGGHAPVPPVGLTSERDLDKLPAHGSVSQTGNSNALQEQQAERLLVAASRVSVTPSPVPTPEPTAKPTPKPTLVPRRHPTRVLTGKASWFATGQSGPYAAACAPLRKAIGPDWRGMLVLVSRGRKAMEVRLVDWCGSKDKTIDLDVSVFEYFAPRSRGVITVSIGW